MNDYIKREDAIEVVSRLSDKDDLEYLSVDALYDEIDRIPTADVVEVVRCRDCKYCCHDLNGMLVCNSNQRVPPFYTDHDFYCAHGERRGDNG